MAIVRKTLSDIQAQGGGNVDRDKVAATTEEDIRRHMIEDGQDPDAEPGPYEVVIPPKLVRERLGMTQSAIAAALRIPVAPWRNWEQNRERLDPAVKTLLTIVYRMPEALRALAIEHEGAA